jgi:hypothetical protein
MGTMPTGFAGSVSNAFGLFGSLSVPYQWLAIGIATFVLWSVKGHYEDKKKWVCTHHLLRLPSVQHSSSTQGHIPIVGSTPLTRWFAPVKYLVYGNRMILEGYKQHKPGLFRIKQFGKWNIFVTTPKALDELRRFPDEVLSSRDAINEVCFQLVAISQAPLTGLLGFGNRMDHWQAHRREPLAHCEYSRESHS